MKPLLTIVTYIYILAVKVLHTFSRFWVTKTKDLSRSCISKAHPFCGQILVWSLLLFNFPSATDATTIVIRRTPKEIVVGADSLITGTQVSFGNLGQRIVTRTKSYTCKIVRVRNRAFSVAGFIGDETGRLGVLAIGADALRRHSSVAASADAFAKTVKEPLRQRLERQRGIDIQTYRLNTTDEETGGTKASLEGNFFAIENGVPIVEYRGLKITNPESEPVALTVVPIRVPNEQFPKSVTAMAGIYKEIQAYRSNGLFWQQYGNVTGIRMLIEIMEKSRDEVGGPIDILRVTSKGIKWMSPEPKCDKDENRVMPETFRGKRKKRK